LHTTYSSSTIPGFQRTGLDLISLGVALARECLAGVGISQPGFGRSQLIDGVHDDYF